MLSTNHATARRASHAVPYRRSANDDIDRLPRLRAVGLLVRFMVAAVLADLSSSTRPRLQLPRDERREAEDDEHRQRHSRIATARVGIAATVFMGPFC